MPKRRVKRIPWEVESEGLVITATMERRIKKGVIQRSIETLAKFSQLIAQEEMFYDLPAATFAAMNLERYDEAGDLARAAIVSAESFDQNWNYGNALHAGHTVLGLLALRDGNLSKAFEELRASGDVPESPQLGSFGPSMQLARELLLQGHSAEVIEFLDQCRSFWAYGGLWLDIWRRKINSGKVPNFFHNRYR